MPFARTPASPAIGYEEHGDAQPGVAADRRQASLAGSLVDPLLGGG
jgi:hypothetical protein